MKFYCNIKNAMKIAGVRFKPLPKSRKRLIKIKRRQLRFFENQIKEDAGEIVGFRHYKDPVTQIPMFERKWKTADGAIHISYEVCSVIGGGKS